MAQLLPVTAAAHAEDHEGGEDEGEDAGSCGDAG
jgi:hypothetical protein